MTFNEFLYELRKEKNLTQNEVADKLGVTNKAVSKWETGETFPDTAQLVPLADLFGVTVDELLRGERNSERQPLVDNAIKEAQPSDENRLPEIKTNTENDKKFDYAGKINGIIMICCVIAYLLMGFLGHLWHPGWIIFPVGGLVCAIIDIVFSFLNKKKD